MEIGRSSSLEQSLTILSDRVNEDKTTPIIVTFKGKKYDLTSFVYKHPGGAKYILGSNGMDIESLMREFEHSKNAYLKLELLRIN
jgi:cytochrome b involved in lipid metabolism